MLSSYFFLVFNFFFSEVFKDSFKVLSQHYRHKLTKLALCISGVNRIHVQDSQAAFFLQGLSCFHFDSWSKWTKKRKERHHLFFSCCFFFLCFVYSERQVRKQHIRVWFQRMIGVFFLYFIWGDLWIKTVAWFLVCDLFIKSRMKFLVGWYAGFLQITLSVLERKWKSLEILFCILSTNYMFYFFRNRYKSSEMKPRFEHDRGLTRELLRPIPQNKVLSALMRQWRNSWNSSKPNAWRLSLMCRLAGYRFQMSFIPLF